MINRAVAIPTTIAALTSAVTIGVWVSIAPASAARAGTVQVVSKLQFIDVIGAVETVDPGDTVEGGADCPSSKWNAVSGGYLMHGTDGFAVASATASFPVKLSLRPGWDVFVTSPHSATGPVTFTVKVRCENEVMTPVTG